jgi:hypothetical protein
VASRIKSEGRQKEKWLNDCSYSKNKLFIYDYKAIKCDDPLACSDVMTVGGEGTRWWPIFVQTHPSHELANINMKYMLTKYTIRQNGA